MKKLKLHLSQVEGVERLNREQLKNVLGGSALDASSTATKNCIADGNACGVFKQCCHECLPTFNCGQPS